MSQPVAPFNRPPLPPQLAAVQPAAVPSASVRAAQAARPQAVPRYIANSPSRLLSPVQESCVSRLARGFCNWVSKCFSCICCCFRRESGPIAREVQISSSQLQSKYNQVMAKLFDLRLHLETLMRDVSPQFHLPVPPRALQIALEDGDRPLSQRQASYCREELLKDIRTTRCFILNYRIASRGGQLLDANQIPIDDRFASTSDERFSESDANLCHSWMMMQIYSLQRSFRRLEAEICHIDAPPLPPLVFVRHQASGQDRIYSMARASHHLQEMYASLNLIDQRIFYYLEQRFPP